MGVVKTASESILEETVVPSEEANYSLQGHAGKSEKGRENVEECVRMRVQLISAVTLCWQLTGGRKIVKEIIAAASQWDQVQRSRSLFEFARSLARSLVRDRLVA